ncbi:MAG: hypothetical protein O2985_13325 [Proteobacteria bacterium]|nr:hypothetical protein [Pseudomonadota bacterium]
MAAAYLFRAKQLRMAERYGERACAKAPHVTGSRFLLGRIQVALGQVDEGFQNIKAAARIDPAYQFAAAVMAFSLTTKDFQRIIENNRSR